MDNLKELLRRKYNYFVQCYETTPNIVEFDVQTNPNAKPIHCIMEADKLDWLYKIAEAEQITNINFKE